MIDSIVTGINAAITAGIATSSLGYGVVSLQELAERHANGEDNYPAVWEITEAWDRLNLKDTVNTLIYHRLISSGKVDRPELSFGLNDHTKQASLRMVIALKRDADMIAKVEELADMIPTTLSLSGFRFIWLNAYEAQHIHDDNMEDEWGEVDYTRHKTTHAVHVITYTVDYSKC